MDESARHVSMSKSFF
jgi:hypothetical protein